MKTISYNEVLYRAAEAAGRTRDNLLATEATVLKSIFAVELKKAWMAEDWNDLRQPIYAAALTSNAFSQVTPTECGEIFNIFDQDPNGSTPWTKLNFDIAGDTVTVRPATERPAYGSTSVPSTVYVHYQSVCPDLLALSQTQLNALTLPLFLGNYLALRGAGHLLTADGAPGLAGVQFGLAESALDFERTRIRRPIWAKPA